MILFQNMGERAEGHVQADLSAFSRVTSSVIMPQFDNTATNFLPLASTVFRRNGSETVTASPQSVAAITQNVGAAITLQSWKTSPMSVSCDDVSIRADAKRPAHDDYTVRCGAHRDDAPRDIAAALSARIRELDGALAEQLVANRALELVGRFALDLCAQRERHGEERERTVDDAANRLGELRAHIGAMLNAQAQVRGAHRVRDAVDVGVDEVATQRTRNVRVVEALETACSEMLVRFGEQIKAERKAAESIAKRTLRRLEADAFANAVRRVGDEMRAVKRDANAAQTRAELERRFVGAAREFERTRASWRVALAELATFAADLRTWRFDTDVSSLSLTLSRYVHICRSAPA